MSGSAQIRWFRLAFLILAAGLALGAAGLVVGWLGSWSQTAEHSGDPLRLDADAVGQAFTLPTERLDRLAIWATKYGRAETAAIEVHLLRGGEPPHDAAELWQRHLGQWDARVRGAADRIEVALPVVFEITARAGERYYLLLQQKRGRVEVPLGLWTASTTAAEWPPAARLRAGSGAGLALEPTPAPIALDMGYVAGRPLRALATTLVYWCGLGLGALLFLWWARRRSVSASDATARPIPEVAPASPGDARLDRLAPWLLGVAALCVLLLFNGFGVSWDEEVQATYGTFLLNYYSAWFPDAAVVDQIRLHDLYYYGGLYEWVVAAAQGISPFSIWDTRHLVNAAVALLGVVGTWKLARLLLGPRAALFAAIALLLTPTYLGHAFNNPKDIPFAVGYVWSLYYLLRLVQAGPGRSPGLSVRLGLVVGLTMAVRVAGGVLLGYLGLAALLLALQSGLAGRRAAPALRQLLQTTAWSLIPAALLAYAVMIFFWPWAQAAPLTRPFAALQEFSTFSMYSETVLFGGRQIPADQLPLDYLLRSFAIKLPELFLLGLGVAAAVGLARLIRRRVDERWLGWLLVGVAALLPPALASARGTVLYDGIRHFIFVLPPLAVAVGLGADWSLRVLGRVPRALRLVAWGILGMPLLVHILLLLLLHPYQYVFYNQLAGGLAGADGRYETDYWAHSYGEAVELLAARLGHGRPGEPPAASVRVHACGPRASAEAFFPDGFSWVESPEQADFYISHTRRGCHRRVEGAPIISVQRLGVTLSVVKDQRAAGAEREAP